ncbi:MAG: phosphoribosylformylglycinamidine synthase I [Candidatus Eremiobacteraeota bacterium]|nr:phosphoribosylformylglycinamidine synthase I [Candidatus Eremiobacteraeota bacterium]
MSARVGSANVGVIVFPGTNSEEETVRACRAVGLEADAVHWNAPLDVVREYSAYILPGGFAYEDRVRAGAIAAHDRLMTAVREGAAAGKPVLGICNGAQVLLETGLVPGFAGASGPQAGFARNAPSGKFRSTHVYVKLTIPPERCTITAALKPNAVIPAWASHGEGRLAGGAATLARIAAGDHLAFVYSDARGNASEAVVPNGSALGAAGLVNAAGNVLALMPHPERDAWTFNHHDASREAARGDAAAMLKPSGGIALFESFAQAVRQWS